MSSFGYRQTLKTPSSEHPLCPQHPTFGFVLRIQRNKILTEIVMTRRAMELRPGLC